MLFQGSKLLHSPVTYATIIIAILLFISFQLRKDDFNEQKAATNIAASYHTLLTVKSLDQSPASDHYFLPTVSLGGAENKGIPWGVTVPTPKGDYIYTSFYTPAFMAPYAWFKLLGQDSTTTNLAHFNFLISSATTFLLFLLCYRLLISTGVTPRSSAAGSLIAVFITIFSREALTSGGLIYWAQSLYQPILVASLICLHVYLSAAIDKVRSWAAWLLVALAFIGALTEWTGFVFNGGATLLLWLHKNSRQGNRKLATGIVLATILSVVVIVLHISAAVGFSPTIEALTERFFARSTSAGSIKDLLEGYWISFGLFLPLLLVAIVFLIKFKSKIPSTIASNSFTIVFLASCIPMLENILMMQHAASFTFDRLKLVIPATILISHAFAKAGTLGRSLIIVATLAASIAGYSSYRSELLTYSFWDDIEKQNQSMADKIKKRPDYACSIITSSIPVRAYPNLLFERGIYESQTPATTAELMRDRGSCASVFIEGSFVFPGITSYTKATITTKEGKIEIISGS